MVNALTLTAFAGLASVVTSFNTHRRTDTEDDIDPLGNNLDRLYIVFEDFVTENASTSIHTRVQPTGIHPTGTPSGNVSDPDPLSVVWYLGAFGGLIAFFLVVTFSEWCCASKHLYRRHALAAPYLNGYSAESRVAPETPPPPYHLFAPPPYAEAACYEKSTPASIFIIPVHQASVQQQSQPAAMTLPPPPAPTVVQQEPIQA